MTPVKDGRYIHIVMLMTTKHIHNRTMYKEKIILSEIKRPLAFSYRITKYTWTSSFVEDEKCPKQETTTARKNGTLKSGC